MTKTTKNTYSENSNVQIAFQGRKPVVLGLPDSKELFYFAKNSQYPTFYVLCGPKIHNSEDYYDLFRLYIGNHQLTEANSLKLRKRNDLVRVAYEFEGSKGDLSFWNTPKNKHSPINRLNGEDVALRTLSLDRII